MCSLIPGFLCRAAKSCPCAHPTPRSLIALLWDTWVLTNCPFFFSSILTLSIRMQSAMIIKQSMNVVSIF